MEGLMKIDLSQIDTESFYVNSHVVAGETLYLVHPKNMGVKWTKDNLIFRSSVWNEQGELVSAGFKKFVNWGEKPDLFPPPTHLGGCELIEKVDGSTLIVSKYKGELIIRTRGCMTPHEMEKSGYEIEMLKFKYPHVFIEDTDIIAILGQIETWPFSYIYEWTSPANKIVINYGDEPELHLIGIVDHENYSYFSQSVLDQTAEAFQVKRPRSFNFDSVGQMLKAIEELKGQEGLCVYFNKGQDILKVKSAWYLTLHKLKSELSSIEKVIDLWLILERPTFNVFYNYICEHFDFELAETSKGLISKVCDGYKEVKKIVEHMIIFTDGVRTLPTRKEQALKITQAYSTTNRAGMCFRLLDNHKLTDDDYKKLIFQVIK
jgi:hypothetical protein